ncbi:hypothetical protein [Dictyobacter aurantiacus]|uniref:Uncharacterized protein n=1 Tax=Dictyobacter aurantiacus TaxID=1936993 RepID=A0A401ZCW7_9CHLR|nr:hypothetical protein [Dictyobacter aurantiacus]GCE04724.1 hypothetical protein KDAU_20530 [Dictyobacter aurantiacus]
MIIGGLIAIAVLALLGAFFLARGGGDKNAKPARVESAQPATPVQPEVEKKATIPAPELKSESQQLEFPKNASMPDLSQDTTTSMPRVNNFEDATQRYNATPAYWPQEHSVSQPEPDVAALNRRLYELAGQLHIMQRQTRDIEQNLMHLSGVIEHMNRTNHNGNGSEPLLSRSSSVPSMPYGD